MRVEIWIKVVLALVAVVVIYLLCAFMAWEMDPALWDPMGRFMMVIVVLASWLGVVALKVERDDRRE